MIMWISQWISCALMVREGELAPATDADPERAGSFLHRLFGRISCALDGCSPLFPLFHMLYYDDGISYST